MKLKVSSYNIFHCEEWRKGKIDYDAFAGTIAAFDSDIIGLNEVHGYGEHEDYDEQAQILGEKTGYNYYFSKATEIDGGNPFGNAMLTRIPIKECVTVPIPDPDPKTGDGYYETRAVIKLTTATTPSLTVLITHFGLNDDEHRNAVDTVLSIMPEENCILMGDLNVEPDNKILDPIRERMKDAAVVSGCTDCSFPADKPYKKIDYIFVSKNIKVGSFYVEDVILSDHRPVSAEIIAGD